MGWVFEDEADAYGDAVFQSFREAEALVPATLAAGSRQCAPGRGEAKSVAGSAGRPCHGPPQQLAHLGRWATGLVAHGVFAVAKQHGLSEL